MPTYIKTGFWEKLKQGSKEWLNLDNLITKIISETPSTGVQSVTGYGVDNTDPLNPIVNKYTSGNLAATGTDLSDAAQIVATSTIITSGASASGVKLPTGAALNNTYYVALGSALNVFIYSNGVNFIVNGVNVGTSYQLSKLQFFYEFRFNGFGWVVSEEQVAPYNYYLASVSQSSTIAPTVNSSTKTFPATITLARAAGGFYTITASAATFTANKTLVTITGTGSGGYADVKFFTPQVSSTTVINFGTARIDGTFDDGFEATIQVIILP